MQRWHPCVNSAWHVARRAEMKPPCVRFFRQTRCDDHARVGGVNELTVACAIFSASVMAARFSGWRLSKRGVIERSFFDIVDTNWAIERSAPGAPCRGRVHEVCEADLIGVDSFRRARACSVWWGALVRNASSSSCVRLVFDDGIDECAKEVLFALFGCESLGAVHTGEHQSRRGR